MFERELALIKVHAEPGLQRSEVMQIAGIFRAKIIDVGLQTLVLEITGDSDKILALESLLRPYGFSNLSGPAELLCREEPPVPLFVSKKNKNYHKNRK